MAGSGTGTRVAGTSGAGGLVTAPAIEPVSLQDMKEHLRLDSGAFTDNLDPEQSIAPGSHATTEILTLNVAPATAWAPGDLITGQTSGHTCKAVAKLTTLTYEIKERTDDFHLDESIGVTGTAAKIANQGAAYPTVAGAYRVIPYELLTLDVAPATAWAAGDVITGNTSGQTCIIIEVLTTKTYTVDKRSGTFTLAETLTNGTATAAQGALFPTLTPTCTDVLGYSAIAILDSGTNGATGKVDAKIQECDTATGTYTDWTGGAFTQVTTANDNAIQKIAYTGSKQYIRVVAYVQSAACEFGISIAKYSSDATEDTDLTDDITAARQQVEIITRRALITQTWDLWLDEFPDKNFIPLPLGQLQTVTSIIYKESDWASSADDVTMTLTTDYLVDDDSEPGRIVLPYDVDWPSFTAYPINPIAIRFVCGYGSTAASVPAGIRTAIKMLAEDLYNDRSATRTQVAGNVTENKTVMALLWPFRLWEF